NSECAFSSPSAPSTVGGGWMVSLAEELKRVEGTSLEISFITKWNQAEGIFLQDGITYRPINPFYSSGELLFRLKRILCPVSFAEKKIISEMLRIIDDVKPDVIHIHGTEKCYGLVSEFVRDIPVAISIQGFASACADVFFCGISEETVRRNESLATRLKRQSVMREYRRFVRQTEKEKNILSKANYIFGRTDWDKEMTGKMNPDRKYFKVNELMRKPFYETEWKGPQHGGKTVLVSTVSNGLYKGFESVLRISAILKSSGLDFEWKIIGYDASSEMVKLAECETGLKSSDFNLVFLGIKTADAISKILAQSHIYCHTSHVDNSPNSLCEAMLVGMPCVAFKVGGISSILEDGTGVLIPDKDAEAFAGAVMELASNPDRCEAMGERAKNKALVRHSPQNVLRQLLTSYTALMQGFRHGGPMTNNETIGL
ncbi:MAG: glycosyltransferase family 4 protein, partial [Candidatus Cryptobacteroides sp.]